MNSPEVKPDSYAFAGLPEQQLCCCEACKAINLPFSNYCCTCGLPLESGALDRETRADVERLVKEARQVAGDGPVWAEAGASFQSRIHQQTISLWPAGLASPYFAADPWSGLGSLEDASVLLIERLDGPLASVVPFLETVASSSRRLIVVTGFVERELLATFVINHLKNTLQIMVLLLSPPPVTHPVLLADLASVLRGKVVERGRLERTAATTLPVVRSLHANGDVAWAAGLPDLQSPPALVGDPGVVLIRRRIYGQSCARIELGANSRAALETRRRYACRLLRSAQIPSVLPPTHLTIGPSSGVQAD